MESSLRGCWAVAALLWLIGAPSDVRSQSARPSRVIWSGALDGASIAPDGRIAAYIDWGTGDVAAYDVSTSHTRRLTNHDAWTRNDGWAEAPLVWSRSGEALVYTFTNTRAGTPYRYELRILSPADGKQIFLDSVPQDASALSALDWHPAAGILYVAAFADESSELRLTTPTRATKRVVASRRAGSGIPRSAVIAPNGEAAVYSVHDTVFQVSLSDGRVQRTAIGAEALLGWDRSGRLLAHATRGDTVGIWAIPITGASTGAAILLERTRRGLLRAGMAGEDVHYIEALEVPRLKVVQLDLAAARVIGEPRFLTTVDDGPAGTPALSPDGARVAYTLRFSNRPLYRLMLADVSSAEAREIARVRLATVSSLHWGTDNRSLIIAGRGESRATSWLGRVDIVSGAIRKLVEMPIQAMAAGPTGAIAYVRAAAAGDSTVDVVLMDHEDGALQVLSTYSIRDYPRSISISPDGRWLAAVRLMDNRAASAVELFPLGGGPGGIIARLQRPSGFDINLRSLPWTSDGKRILAVARRDGVVRFVTVDVSSGALTELPLPLTDTERRHPALSSDDRRLVFSDGMVRDALRALPSSR